MCEQAITIDKCHNDRKFRIEDNILIGQEVPLSKEPVNVSELILKTLKSKPDHIGQVDALTDKVNTYADMSERSIKCALWLKKQGVKSGDIISLCTDNNLDAIAVLLGTLYIGAISSTWDHILYPITARYFLTLISPKIIFTVTQSAAILTEVAKELKMNVKIVVLGKLDGYESLEDILRGHETREIIEFKCTPISSPHDVAFIVLSSGTTGPPKASEISHYSCRSNLLPLKFADIESQVCMFTPTFRWYYGVINAFTLIMAYSTRIIVPDYDDAVAICEFIEKYRVTWFATDPFMLIKFIKDNLIEKYRLPTVKKIISAGAHFREEYHAVLAKKLPHVWIANSYGMTDVGGGCCLQSKHSKLGSVGFVSPTVQLRIADLETGKTLGANETGEIRLKVPSVMNGYYKNPEATKKCFDSDGWLRSGDVAYYDEDGEVFIVDRISAFINFRSINVSPAEIEAVLETHPAVFQAAVIGIPHQVDEQHPMAVVSLVPGKTITEGELIGLVEKNLPDHCRLRGGIKFIDELPRTPSKKILKRQLQKMFAN